MLLVLFGPRSWRLRQRPTEIKFLDVPRHAETAWWRRAARRYDDFRTIDLPAIFINDVVCSEVSSPSSRCAAKHHRPTPSTITPVLFIAFSSQSQDGIGNVHQAPPKGAQEPPQVTPDQPENYCPPERVQHIGMALPLGGRKGHPIRGRKVLGQTHFSPYLSFEAAFSDDDDTIGTLPDQPTAVSLNERLPSR